jgi:hypothetical protein
MDGDVLNAHFFGNKFWESNPIVKGIGFFGEDMDLTLWIPLPDFDRCPRTCHPVSNDKISFHPPLPTLLRRK